MKELNTLRKKVDKIDKDIISLLAKRISISKKIASVKKKHNLKIVDKKRQNSLIKKIKASAKKFKLNQKTVSKIFKDIIKDSVKVQRSKK